MAIDEKCVEAGKASAVTYSFTEHVCVGLIFQKQTYSISLLLCD